MATYQGRPCRKCGNSERYSKTRRCVACSRERNKNRDKSKRAVEGVNSPSNFRGNAFVLNSVMRAGTLEAIPTERELAELKWLLDAVREMNGADAKWSLHHKIPVAPVRLPDGRWRAGKTSAKNLAIVPSEVNQRIGKQAVSEDGESIVFTDREQLSVSRINAHAITQNGRTTGEWFKATADKSKKGQLPKGQGIRLGENNTVIIDHNVKTDAEDVEAMSDQKKAMNAVKKGTDDLTGYRRLFMRDTQQDSQFMEEKTKHAYHWLKVLDARVVDHEATRLQGATVMREDAPEYALLRDWGAAIQTGQYELASRLQDSTGLDLNSLEQAYPIKLPDFQLLMDAGTDAQMVAMGRPELVVLDRERRQELEKLGINIMTDY